MKRSMKRVTLLNLIFFLTSFYCLGFQTETISGIVSDIKTNEPLPGVSIRVMGTTNGTTTNLDGAFSFSVSSSSELQFSFIGYETQTIAINGRSIVNVQLAEDVKTLSEVVVVGYGSIKKSDLSGAVSSLKGDELVTVPTVNAVDALQGKVAGVQITNSSGAPGSSPTVRIRGVGTPGDPSPIYVVDGVILNDISFLNSRDIESIEVLKDASALAIYGNRGANGVIIVTTKLGKKGEVASISVNSEYGVQVQQRKIDLLTGKQFAEVVNAIDPGTYNNLDILPNTDWQELIFEQAPVQSHQVSVQGGSETNQYFFSLGYFDQSGTLPESRYKRITIKINDRYSPKKYLSLGTNVTIAPFERNNTINNAPFNTYRAWPIVDPYTADGDFNEVPNVGNVLADFKYNTDNQTRGISTVGQVYGEAHFLDGFTFKSSVGIELLIEENEAFVPVYSVGQSPQQNPESRYSIGNFRRSSVIWENTLNYDKKIEKSQINAVVGYTLQTITNEFFRATARNLVRDSEDFRYINPGNVDPNSVGTGIGNANDFYNQLSYLARLNYSFDSKYIATFTFRRDGSSKFLGDNKYGNFPAVGLAWNAINESFLKFPAVVTNAKIRASWGRVGNDKINYLAGYNTVGNSLNGVFGSPEFLGFGQSDDSFGNPNLRWEIVEQYNIGLELGFYKERLTAELDYFNRDSDGFLVALDIPAYLGNGNGKVFYNAGKVRNRGFEFNLNWQDDIGDVSYSIGFNGATLKNEVIRVSGVEGSDELPGFLGDQVTRTAAGLPIGSFYGYQVAGVFQNAEEIDNTPSFSGTQPGDLIFADIDQNGVLNGNDRTLLGSPIPDFTYGINLGLSYKGFGIDVLFQGQEGNEIMNYKETVRPDRYNFEAHVYDYWRGEGTSNTEPRPTDGGNNYRISSRYIQDGSFFRLRTATIYYNLPEKILNAIGFKSGRLYIRGNNIFTVTDFTGYSPEIAGGPLLNGIDQGTYPVASVYSGGFNLTF